MSKKKVKEGRSGDLGSPYIPKWELFEMLMIKFGTESESESYKCPIGFL